MPDCSINAGKPALANETSLAETTIPLVDVVCLSHELCAVPVKANLKYATEKNFIGRPVSGYEKNITDFALLTTKAASQLCLVQNDLFENYRYGLLIYDAYRPKRAVQDFLFWSQQPATDAHELHRKKKHYPHLEKSQLFELGYLAMDSDHCYGNTVDLVLTDSATGKNLPMGARFDFMDELSHYSASATQIGEHAYNNRIILRTAMEKYGFQAYEKEYWHFCHAGKQGREVDAPIDIVITERLRNAR